MATVPLPNFSAFDDTARAGPVRPLAKEAFGQFLFAARRRSGLSLEDIAASTKVPLHRLQALEQGDIDQLPAGVYRRAWVRSYATAVGLSPDLAIAEFDRMTAPPPPVPVETRSTEPASAAAARATLAPRPVPRVEAPAASDGVERRHRAVEWLLPAAVIVIAAVALAPLVRSTQDASSAGEDSAALDDAAVGAASGTAATRGEASRASDVTLVPDPVPEVMIPDPRLVITSQPSGARVTVNGIGWGVTPLTIRNLPPGPKRIRATKDGYVGREASVEFGISGGNETVRLTLRPQN